MELTTEQLADGIERINLTGRMDSAGTDLIAMRFTALTATRPARIVVDMAQVPFLSSIGIRLLLSNAKALKQRGGRMVIARPATNGEGSVRGRGDGFAHPGSRRSRQRLCGPQSALKPGCAGD